MWQTVTAKLGEKETKTTGTTGKKSNEKPKRVENYRIRVEKKSKRKREPKPKLKLGSSTAKPVQVNTITRCIEVIEQNKRSDKRNQPCETITIDDDRFPSQPSPLVHVEFYESRREEDEYDLLCSLFDVQLITAATKSSPCVHVPSSEFNINWCDEYNNLPVEQILMSEFQLEAMRELIDSAVCAGSLGKYCKCGNPGTEDISLMASFDELDGWKSPEAAQSEKNRVVSKTSTSDLQSYMISSPCKLPHRMGGGTKKPIAAKASTTFIPTLSQYTPGQLITERVESFCFSSHAAAAKTGKITRTEIALPTSKPSNELVSHSPPYLAACTTSKITAPVCATPKVGRKRPAEESHALSPYELTGTTGRNSCARHFTASPKTSQNSFSQSSANPEQSIYFAVDCANSWEERKTQENNALDAGFLALDENDPMFDEWSDIEEESEKPVAVSEVGSKTVGIDEAYAMDDSSTASESEFDTSMCGRKTAHAVIKISTPNASTSNSKRHNVEDVSPYFVNELSLNTTKEDKSDKVSLKHTPPVLDNAVVVPKSASPDIGLRRKFTFKKFMSTSNTHSTSYQEKTPLVKSKSEIDLINEGTIQEKKPPLMRQEVENIFERDVKGADSSAALKNSNVKSTTISSIKRFSFKCRPNPRELFSRAVDDSEIDCIPGTSSSEDEDEDIQNQNNDSDATTFDPNELRETSPPTYRHPFNHCNNEVSKMSPAISGPHMSENVKNSPFDQQDTLRNRVDSSPEIEFLCSFPKKVTSELSSNSGVDSRVSVKKFKFVPKKSYVGCENSSNHCSPITPTHHSPIYGNTSSFCRPSPKIVSTNIARTPLRFSDQHNTTPEDTPVRYRKRGQARRYVIDSDESPAREKRPAKKQVKKRKRNPFLFDEAAGSGDDSSVDEMDEMHSNETSFVVYDNDSDEEEMMVTASQQQAMYLQSVKDVVPIRAGRVEDPMAPDFDMNTISYLNDSFCDEDVEYADVGVFTQCMNAAREEISREKAQGRNNKRKLRPRR